MKHIQIQLKGQMHTCNDGTSRLLWISPGLWGLPVLSLCFSLCTPPEFCASLQTLVCQFRRNRNPEIAMRCQTPIPIQDLSLNWNCSVIPRCNLWTASLDEITIQKFQTDPLPWWHERGRSAGKNKQAPQLCACSLQSRYFPSCYLNQLCPSLQSYASFYEQQLRLKQINKNQFKAEMNEADTRFAIRSVGCNVQRRFLETP